MYPRLRKRGFGLVELAIALAIVALLVAATVVGWPSYLRRSKATAAQANLHNVQHAVDQYFTEFGLYPTLGGQPRLGDPKPIDWSLLVPGYLHSVPGDAKERYYWVDVYGKVYSSIHDAPTGFVVNQNGSFSWNAVPGAETYDIWQLIQNSFIRHVLAAVNLPAIARTHTVASDNLTISGNKATYSPTPPADPSGTYYISARSPGTVSETPPVDDRYSGHAASEDQISTGYTPTVVGALREFTLCTSIYDSSADIAFSASNKLYHWCSTNQPPPISASPALDVIWILKEPAEVYVNDVIYARYSLNLANRSPIYSPKTAVSYDGDLYIAGYYYGYGCSTNQVALLVAKVYKNGQMVLPKKLSCAPDVGFPLPAIFVDRGNTVWIIGNQIAYALGPDLNIIRTSNINVINTTSTNPRALVDTAGRVWIVYAAGYTVNYKVFDLVNGAFTEWKSGQLPQVPGGTTVLYPDIALKPDGSITILWSQYVSYKYRIYWVDITAP